MILWTIILLALSISLYRLRKTRYNSVDRFELYKLNRDTLILFLIGSLLLSVI